MVKAVQIKSMYHSTSLLEQCIKLRPMYGDGCHSWTPHRDCKIDYGME